MKIRVNPHNVEIIREQTEPINEKEIKVSKCVFEFDDKITNDFVKEAYFTLNGETYKQIIQNNECEYPSEVLTQKGTLEIGVVAYKVKNEQEIVRYNPSPDYFESWVGSLKDAENTEPITPTDKEQMEQLLQKGLNDINNKIDEADEKLDGIETAIEETNNLNLDVSDKVDGDVTVTLTKKDASTKTVVLSDGTSLEFNWDGTKLGIKTSDEEEYTYVDLQGIQGPAGPQGEAFRIKKTYSSVAEMNADFNNMEYGDYVMIASSVEVEDNAKLYTRGETQWIFITDFSGSQGIKGETGLTPSIQIGTVVSGATPSVTRTGTDENPVFNFVLQKGDRGDRGNTGDTGNGISSIEKTGTTGLVDTYTITYTNGNTTTFNVSNGNGIDRIEKTATVGNKDTYTIYFTNGSTTTYEVSNGEVTREELEEEVDRLSMIYNAFPSTTGEVEEGSINGTAEVPFKEIGLKGNTSQESTTGKNLEPSTANSFSGSGMIFKKNNDGSWTLNGTNNTADTRFYRIADDFTLPAGTYTLSNGNSNVSDETAIFYDDNWNFNRVNINTKTFSEAKTIKPYIKWKSGVTLTNFTIYPMIEAGSSETSYEPYTGGNPAPNPDYPYPVNVVTGDNEVKVEGKNLFDKDYYLNIPKTDWAKVYSNYFICIELPNIFKKKITCSMELTGTNQNLVFGLKNNIASLSDDAFRILSNGTLNSPKTYDFTNDEHIYLLIGNQNQISSNKNEIDLILNNYDIQIELGETATPYEPYQSQTYPINLGSMELCKIGDYQDYIYKNNGNWYKYGAIGKVVLDGSENWNVSGNGTNTQRYATNVTTYGVMSASNGYCNNNKYVNSGVSRDEQLCGISSGTYYYRLNQGILSEYSATKFKEWVANNNITNYIPLVTPTITEITDTTLIEQLDNLEKAYSYDTQTNISQTNQDKPFIISYEAILSLRNVLEI